MQTERIVLTLEELRKLSSKEKEIEDLSQKIYKAEQENILLRETREEILNENRELEMEIKYTKKEVKTQDIEIQTAFQILKDLKIAFIESKSIEKTHLKDSTKRRMNEEAITKELEKEYEELYLEYIDLEKEVQENDKIINIDHKEGSFLNQEIDRMVGENEFLNIEISNSKKEIQNIKHQLSEKANQSSYYNSVSEKNLALTVNDEMGSRLKIDFNAALSKLSKMEAYVEKLMRENKSLRAQN